VLAAGLFGLSVGNLLMTQPLWLAEVYPPQIYRPSICPGQCHQCDLGVAFGPYCMGLIFDASPGTTYTYAYLVAVASSLFSNRCWPV